MPPKYANIKIIMCLDNNQTVTLNRKFENFLVTGLLEECKNFIKGFNLLCPNATFDINIETWNENER